MGKISFARWNFLSSLIKFFFKSIFFFSFVRRSKKKKFFHENFIFFFSVWNQFLKNYVDFFLYNYF